MTCVHPEDHKCPTCHPELWNPKPGAARAFTIDFLSKKILEAKHAYYVLGVPIMRDDEYDSLEGSLRAYAPDHPVLQKVGADQEEETE